MFKKILTAAVVAVAASAADPVAAASPAREVAEGRPVEVLIDRGQELMKDKKYEEAAQYFEAVLKLEPNNVVALEELGWIYNDIEQFDLAIKRCTTLVEAEPENSGGWRELGYAQWKTGKYLRAIESLKTAARFGDKEEPAHNYLIAVYLDLNEPQLAKEWLSRRAARFPDTPLPSWLDDRVKQEIGN
jgi:tetratricopeptide (TPR) repeat protein